MHDFPRPSIKTTHYRKIQKKVASPLNKTVHYGKREYDILRVEIRQNRIFCKSGKHV